MKTNKVKTLNLIDFSELIGIELYPFQKEIISFFEKQNNKQVKYHSTPSERKNIFIDLMKENDSA